MLIELTVNERDRIVLALAHCSHDMFFMPESRALYADLAEKVKEVTQCGTCENTNPYVCARGDGPCGSDVDQFTGLTVDRVPYE